MTTVPGLSRSDFQTGDEPGFGIQADMRFVTKEIFGLFDLLTRFCFDLAFVLGPQWASSSWEPFPLFCRALSLAVFTLAILWTLSIS